MINSPQQWTGTCHGSHKFRSDVPNFQHLRIPTTRTTLFNNKPNKTITNPKMSLVRLSLFYLSQNNKLINPSTCVLPIPIHLQIQTRRAYPPPSGSPMTASVSTAHQVPGEIEECNLEKSFERYSNRNTNRKGKGIGIVWFRNDLRVLDNEVLYTAWDSCEALLPVYCVDPRLFSTTHFFAFPKTGALRAQFLIECLVDLKNNLMKRGLNLLIQNGKPEKILPSLAEAYGAHTVFALKETCHEEILVERRISEALQNVMLPPSAEQTITRSSTKNPKLKLVWGHTMYHINDLPFDVANLPDVYTQFRKAVEYKCQVRGTIKMPMSLGPPPKNVSKGLRFVGGESAALSRDLVQAYKETRNGMLGPNYSTKFSPWLASGSLSPHVIYEEVKRYEKERVANESTYWVLFELIWRDYFRFLSIKYGNSIFMIGGPRKLLSKWSQDLSLFNSWRDGRSGYPLIDANMKELSATGFMSNRGRQELGMTQERTATSASPSKQVSKGLRFVGGESAALSRDLVQAYKETRNGMLGPNYSTKFSPWLASGSLSPHVIYEEVKRYEKERAAQENCCPNGAKTLVCSIHGGMADQDMGVDWRMGAEWFETCLLDYDPCSNYGNWTYGAGVGNDPREDRYFSIPKQAQTYDPEGEYVAYWLPELRTLAKDERHSPGGSYIPQIVPLKHGNAYNRHNGSGSRSGAYARPRSRNFRSAQAKTEDRKGGPSGKQMSDVKRNALGGNIYDSTLVYNSTIGKISTCLSVD
ncbi:DNA photolyase, N-terminal [Dillenia turbinata]|uniref:Cryptochrome DASH n=1 Tax=Dillenia turbinata TaxID=194707 RepID=A0AAN8UKV3_9MAGN